jgi:hypothetical protein
MIMSQPTEQIHVVITILTFVPGPHLNLCTETIMNNVLL